MNFKTATILAATAIMTASCCPCRKGTSQNADLNGTTWKAVIFDFNGTNKVVAEQNPGEYTLIINDGQINGVGDCNSYFGTLTEKNGKITVSNMGSTKAMCPNQEWEDCFLEIIGSANGYSIEGDKLMLLKDGRVRAIFKAQK